MKNRRKLVWITALIGLVGLWFLAVDESVFEVSCPDCCYIQTIVQFRVARIALSEDHYSIPTFYEHIAMDLGVQCPHRNVERHHLIRKWGLIYCARPCIYGITQAFQDDPRWFNESVREELRRLGREDPSLGSEFLEKVLFQHDELYWEEFKKKLQTPSDGGPTSDEPGSD